MPETDVERSQANAPSDMMQDPPREQLDALFALYNQGKVGVVLEQAEALVKNFPRSFTLWQLLGAVNVALKRLDQAGNAFAQACDLKPADAAALSNLGTVLQAQGRIAQAIAAYQRAILSKPDFAGAHHNLGNALRAQGKLDDAIAAFQRAVAIKPDHASAHNSLGKALHDRGRLDEAIASYRRAITIKPDYAAAYTNLGTALRDAGRLDEAITAHRCAIAAKPDYVDAHSNLGNALRDQGRLDEAIAAHRRAIAIKPDHADAYSNLGAALSDQGKLDEAVAACQRAIAIKPNHADAYCNLGVAFRDQGKLDEAVAAAQRAIAIKPDHADAYSNLGATLSDQGKLDEAVAACQRAIAIKPNHADAYSNLGATLSDQGKLDKAIAAYQRAISIRPNWVSHRAEILHLKRKVCDWRNLEGIASILDQTDVRDDAISPFAMLSFEDNADLQMRTSERYARIHFKSARPPLIKKIQSTTARIRIGYFGSDFHDHATMILISGLIREHDRENFEVFIYSYGRNKSGKMRDTAKRYADHFYDVDGWSDQKILDLVCSDSIDIAIDLKGYTKESRTSIFTNPLAPIKINYLGYPGTMAADFIDYIIADPILIPPDQRRFYAENIIYMPHSYQPNDCLRDIKATNNTRRDFGLPERAFVFCCFNNNYKISPREFNIWMRLLGAVDGSVLWLLRSNKWAEQNLRSEAASRGIDPFRLVFADSLPHAEHLARYMHADLFVDTFNYNAHTTASDALWAGLPVVTRIGEQFAARVAASLLHAVGLPELITTTDEEYEALIHQIATDRAKLEACKNKLSHNRMTHPLFDTKRYTRNFEDGLRRAYDLHRLGQPPADIWITDNNA